MRVESILRFLVGVESMGCRVGFRAFAELLDCSVHKGVDFPVGHKSALATDAFPESIAQQEISVPKKILRAAILDEQL